MLNISFLPEKFRQLNSVTLLSKIRTRKFCSFTVYNFESISKVDDELFFCDFSLCLKPINYKPFPIVNFSDRFNDVEIEYSQHNSDSPCTCVHVDLTIVRPVFEMPNFPSTLMD